MQEYTQMLWWKLLKLKSKDPKIRQLAIEQLAQCDYNDVIEHLKLLSKDSDSEVRCKVVEILSKHQEPKSVPILVSLARDTSEKVRELSLAVLASYDGRKFQDIFISSLKDSSANVRWRAAKALDDLGWIPSSDSEKAVKFVALGEYEKAIECGNAAMEPLLAALKENVYYKRQSALEAISRLSDARVPKALLSALNDEDVGVRSTAIDALARLGDTRAVDPLIKALKSTDANVRVRAVDALGKMDDVRAIEPISQLLRDPSWEVRQTTVNALGNLKAIKMIEPIAALLKDCDPEVKEASVKALQKMGDLRVVEHLVPMIIDPHDNVRKLTYKALSKLDPEWQKSESARKVIPELKNSCKHHDHKIRQAAANALTELGEDLPINQTLASLIEKPKNNKRTAYDVLLILLDDADPALRMAAAEGLGRLADKRAEPKLESMLMDLNSWVRRAAARSLSNLDWHPEDEIQKARISQLLDEQ